MIDKARWQNAQDYEAGYWGSCNNLRTWEEYVKHEMVGREMGLFSDYGTPGLEFDMQEKSVLDIGGGPISMTLRCFNTGRIVVVDPCDYPAVVKRRYDRHGIQFLRCTGEELGQRFLSDDTKFDEVWMYNLLQHVQDPGLIVQNAIKRISDTGCLRVFEWLYIPADECHPHVLTPEKMIDWLKGCEAVSIRMPRLEEHNCNATAFVGIFTNP